MLRTFIVLCFLAPYTLIASIAGLLASSVTGSVAPMYRLARWGIRAALALSGTRVDARGVERVGDGRNTVLMANHVSHLDAPLLLQVLGVDFKAVLKKELMRLPAFGRVLRRAGFIEVDRHDRAQAAEAITRTTRSLEEGSCFLIFPEGTRSTSGELGEFKKGGFVAALQARSRILPVAVSGTRELMPRGRYRIQPGKVRIEVLDPVDAGSYSYHDRDRLIAEVRGRIAAALAEPESRPA